jgi:8-oxo-dGTP pyrophosphatase MutT (NUDIX family)
MHFPDEIRWEQNRICNLLLQYYDVTKCGAIITKDNGSKILLVQDRRTGKHGLPKGKIHEEETEEDCARR